MNLQTRAVSLLRNWKGLHEAEGTVGSWRHSQKSTQASGHGGTLMAVISEMARDIRTSLKVLQGDLSFATVMQTVGF